MKLVITREIAVSAAELWSHFGAGFGEWAGKMAHKLYGIY
jgi:hypothetical protein